MDLVRLRYFQQIVALRSGDLDAGILPLPMNDPELDLIKLGSCSLIAAFSERLPLARKGALRLRDLRHQPVVALPDQPDNLYSCILPYLKKEKIPAWKKGRPKAVVANFVQVVRASLGAPRTI
jgi:DNA-binding transcriptional LysR family regulator